MATDRRGLLRGVTGGGGAGEVWELVWELALPRELAELAWASRLRKSIIAGPKTDDGPCVVAAEPKWVPMDCWKVCPKKARPGEQEPGA